MTDVTHGAAQLASAASPPAPKHVVWALVLVMLAQAGVLIGEWLVAHYPLWTGQEVRLPIRPVDPRDLFRGNYVRLNYDFSVLPRELGKQSFDRGDVVYVSLTEDPDSGWQAQAIHAEPPGQGVFLRARVMRVYLGNYSVFRGFDQDNNPVREQVSTLGSYSLRYGIEAWFAPTLRARELETTLRSGGWAVVKVADSGRAALVSVESNVDGETGERREPAR